MVRNRRVAIDSAPAVRSETGRLFLTELEAAYGARETGRAVASVARNTAADEVERIRKLLQRFRKAIEKKIRRAGKGQHWEPSLDDCRAVAAITAAADRAVALDERLRKAHAQDRGGYTDEQLEAVWQHHLQRAASTMGPDDWWLLLKIGFGAQVARVLVREKFGQLALDEVLGVPWPPPAPEADARSPLDEVAERFTKAAGPPAPEPEGEEHEG